MTTPWLEICSQIFSLFTTTYEISTAPDVYDATMFDQAARNLIAPRLVAFMGLTDIYHRQHHKNKGLQ
jgi:hypothetical protein